ncbi:ATP-binding protein [Flavobacteriaceae bacterium]|nr:ATP-binding protein [Flavobacteriaceae bacterium]
MIKPVIPKNENERLQALASYRVLDTISESDYDNITAIASEICNTPISLVSLIDNKRQWFKSHHGLDATETPKEIAFCAHAINKPNETFIIPDSRKDERFFDNPLVTGDPNVIFYAGVPLIDTEGFALGTLCVIDNKPKEISQKQIDSLNALAKQVTNLLALRRNKIRLEESLQVLEKKNKELEAFAYIAAHDLKSPLNNIVGLASLLNNEYSNKLDEDGKKMLGLLNSSSTKLMVLINGLLNHSKNSEDINELDKSEIKVEAFINTIRNLFVTECKNEIILNSELKNITTNTTSLEQILINLISNAIKYNNKEIPVVQINLAQNNTHYLFTVKDNGIGIQENKQTEVFDIFKTLDNTDRFGEKGNGIGLSTVKKIVENLGGTISLNSEIEKGSTFNFSIKK